MSDLSELTIKEAVERMHIVLSMADSDVWDNFNDGTEKGKRAETNVKIIELQLIAYLRLLVNNDPVAMMTVLFRCLKQLASTGNAVYALTDEQREELKKKYGL